MLALLAAAQEQAMPSWAIGLVFAVPVVIMAVF